MKLFFQYKKSYRTLNIFLALLIVFGLFILCGVQLSTNKNFMNAVALATTVKPESFTELYFENHLNLPSGITPNKLYSFKFTIHNLENRDMTYPYEVYLQSGNIKLPIEQNSVTIKNNQYKTIGEAFLVDAPITRSLIVVYLINKNQQIDFWITNPQTQ